MKKLGLMIATLAILAAPSLANAQSVVIGGGHQQGHGGHQQGARAQAHVIDTGTADITADIVVTATGW